MKKTKNIVVILGFTAALLFCCDDFKKENIRKPVKLTGDYLGQKSPGSVPEVFAPGIVSSRHHEHSFPAISPGGNEIIWTVVFRPRGMRVAPAMLYVNRKNGVWGTPEVVPFWNNIASGEAVYSKNGNRLIFGSDRPLAGENKDKRDTDLWYVDKEESSWGKPVKISSRINTDKNEMQPSVTKDGTLYYTGHWEKGKNNFGIFRSRFINSEFTEPELLDSNINTEYIDWTPFIAPDESYILFSSNRPGGFGNGDIYISLRNSYGSWSVPENLGPEINTETNQRFPYISPDGRYLFFLDDKVKSVDKESLTHEKIQEWSGGAQNGFCDIYWVKADVVNRIIEKANNK